MYSLIVYTLILKPARIVQTNVIYLLTFVLLAYFFIHVLIKWFFKKNSYPGHKRYSNKEKIFQNQFFNFLYFLHFVKVPSPVNVQYMFYKGTKPGNSPICILKVPSPVNSPICVFKVLSSVNSPICFKVPSPVNSPIHLENPEFQTRWYFKYFLGKRK